MIPEAKAVPTAPASPADDAPKRRAPVPIVWVVLAAACEIFAVVVVLGLNSGLGLAAGGGAHVVAALCSLRAAKKRRATLSAVERDLVLLSGLLVPFFGPIAGWALPEPFKEEEIENAHEVFEKYERHVKPPVPEYERTLFTGDYERDLARELDAESYHEVLRHGQTDQKRNALRRLAELGEPKHFELIRKCLLDPEHEVRLYAYSELERASREYEEEIAKRSKQLARKPDDTEALMALAELHFRYAGTGIHDEQMAGFYYKTCERYARQAREKGFAAPDAAWLEARSLGRTGAFDEALAVLGSLPADQQDLPPSCLVRAAIAYRMRDFASVRREAEKVLAAGVELPAWLSVLDPKGVQA